MKRQIFSLLICVVLLAPFARLNADSVANSNNGGLRLTDLSYELVSSDSPALARFLITNTSNAAKDVDFSLNSSSGDLQYHARLHIEPRSSERQDVPLLRCDEHNARFTAKVNDCKILDFAKLECGWYTYKYGRQHMVYCSDLRNSKSSDYKYCSAGDYSDAWPGDWRAYIGFSCVVIADKDWNSIPVAAKHALREYVFMGGHLLFDGMKKMPEDFIPAALSAKSTHYGFGVVSFASMPVVEKSPDLVEPDSREGYGSQKAPMSEYEKALLHVGCYNRNVLQMRGWDYFNTIFNHPKTPFSVMLLILICFSIYGGPVMIRRLLKRGEPIRILYKLPILSTIVCVAIVAYTLLNEGLVPSICCHSATFIDQLHGVARTMGVVGLYAPNAQTFDLHFQKDSWVSALQLSKSGRSRHPTIDLNRDVSVSKKLIIPRSPTFFDIRRTEPTHLRLNVSQNDVGELVVENALGVKVENLTVITIDGKIYCANDLERGESRVLSIGHPDVDYSAYTPANVFLFRADNNIIANNRHKMDAILRAINAPASKLWWREIAKEDTPPYSLGTDGDTKGYYIATVPDETPFIKDPAESATAHRVSNSIIYGRF